MASTCTSSFSSSQERTNFARLCWIVVDVFRDIFWHVLTLEIPPTDLPNKVLANQHKLGKLNKNIKAWLCQIHHAPASEDFDVTSLYTLIRNLCRLVPIPTNGWGQPPPTSGGNIGDDLERARVLRNIVYGHAKKGHVNASEYNIICGDMRSIVTNFDGFFRGNCDFVGRIDSIFKCSMDQALQNTYIDKMQEIAKLSGDVENIRQELGVIREDVKSLEDKTYEEIAESRKAEGDLGIGLYDLRNRVDVIEKGDIENIRQELGVAREDVKSLDDKTYAEIAKSRKVEGDLRMDIYDLRNRIDVIEKGKDGKTFIDKREQQRIIDLSQRVLEQHRSHAEKNFVETQRYRAAKDILSQHRRLIITGKSGQGKTYLAHHLMQEIIAVDPTIKPLIISTVDQWKNLVDSSITLGIIVDDMCGKFCLNKGELLKWKEESSYMTADIENRKHVVLFIMKSLFYQKILMAMLSCSLFSTQAILNLDNIILELEDKAEFARTYLKDFYLNNVEVSNLCNVQEASIGFPQLCRAAEMIKEKSRLLNLFCTPQEMILQQIKHIRCDDSMTYACLILVLLFRGKLNMQSITECLDQQKENIVISVFRSCGITEVIPIKVIDTVKSFQGIYLSCDAPEELYSFAHDSIEEAVFMSYGEFFPEQTLLYSPLHLICKRCTIKYDSNVLQTAPQDNILIVQALYQTILINRFKKALKEGNPKDFTTISEAIIWYCKEFRKAFFLECKEIHFLADKDENSLLVHAANANNRDLVDQFLHELNHIPVETVKTLAPFLTKSAKASCAHKDIYLLKKICHNCRVDVNYILPDTIQHGCVEAIEFLLQSGADINYRFENGATLLHIACRHCRLDIAKLLHSKNANLVNEFDDDNRSVGHYVAAGGSVEILEFLLPLGLKPSYTDSTGHNLLHLACRHANIGMAEHLIDTYPNLLCGETDEGMSVLLIAALGGNITIFQKLCDLMEDSQHGDESESENKINDITYSMHKTKDQRTLLHISCQGEGKEITKYLIEKYPEMLLEVDNRKRTPAHYAAESGNVAVLKYIIDRGTDPWCRTSQEQTLLHMACLGGELEMTKYLIENYPKMLHEVDNTKMTPAYYAAQFSHVAHLSYMIDRGADPWSRSSQGDTLLHRACISGQLEMTKYLAEIYPNMLLEVDNTKRTPAHDAAESGHVAVLSYLIDRGADPWCRSSQGRTLLHQACLGGELEMTKYLVEAYLNMLLMVDNRKRTPAHDAAESGHVAVLSYLIDRGADPWCRTSEEQTLLHIACLGGELEMTKYLTETYPKMLLEVDNTKRTPADYAAQEGHVAVLTHLIDRGADPCCRTSQEQTLLHASSFYGQLEVTAYLAETYPKMLLEVDSRKRTPAHYAAQRGHVAVLTHIIDRGADPWCRSSQNETLLHKACLGGKLEMTKYLVETYHKMLFEVDNTKRTPAHIAADNGHVAVLSYLIDRGADPWCRTSQEKTLIHQACLGGKLEMTKYLTETYPKMLLEVDNTKRTPAHDAAKRGHVAVLSYLTDRGADPWCRSSHQQTLLHIACLGGELEMTKYLTERYPKMLLEVDNTKRTPADYAAQEGHVAVLTHLIDRGADPCCRTSQEQTLLHASSFYGQLEVTAYLAETYPKMLLEVDNTKRTPAHYAAQRGHVPVLTHIIDRGADPWCRSSQNETLLHKACLGGKLEMTKYLVETYHKMLFEVDNTKRTPAHIAAENGHVAVLSYLIDRGADPWCRSSHGQTLLHQACLGGKLEMTKYLVEAYPKMLIEMNNNQITPAHAAAESGHVAVLSYLIDRGADPWCRTSQEQTLLHQACLGGELEMTKYLTETYPKMLLEVDNTKKTPAHDAALSGHVAVLSYLTDRGADPWCRSSHQQTLLHIACLGGELEMTKYLTERYPKMLLEVDNTKRTPADYAAQEGHVAVLTHLIDRGADPCCRTSQEQTLLHASSFYGQLEVTAYLAETYPKMLLEVDSRKRTPAHYAAERGHVAVLTHIIDRGADPWCRSSQNETLLHTACLGGKLEMTKYLVETYHKMLFEVDNTKRTPAHIAAENGHVAVLSYLIDRGADPWCRTSQEQTLLHQACLGGELEMTKYLTETYPKMLLEVDNTKRTPAHDAAKRGHVAVLSYLIDRGADPWSRSSHGQTLLHQACLGGKLEMTKYLVEAYPNMLIEVDNSRSTPAHDAAESGHVAVLSYLIDRGADPWCRTSQEQTLLHMACFGGELEMTKYLTETYPKMLLEVDNTKRTPADYAAQEGHVAVLTHLIDRGADPWCRSCHGQTLLHQACLGGELGMTKYLVETYHKMLHEMNNTQMTPAHFAAESGHLAVLRYLIDRGADPWCRSSHGRTLLHQACLGGELEMTKYLTETYPNMLHEVDNTKKTPAHDAALSGHVAVLSYLTDRGADPWCRSSHQQTLLHRACLGGELEMTKYLTERYPKMLLEVDNTKRTPADYAAQEGHVAVLTHLIDRGADPCCRTSQEQTLLHASSFYGQLEVTAYLAETYPKMLLEVDSRKRTPAHYAAERGHVAVLTHIIDRGADPWCRSSQNETLLHTACLGGKLEMTKYLVETYHKMLFEVDNTKRTPAHIAAENGHVAVLSYLIDRGADPWCRSSHGQTLLHQACLCGKLEMTKYLVEAYPNMILEVDNSRSTPAHDAAESGHVAVLSYLIDRGADPWCRTSQEQTLLHMACFGGELEMTKYLTERYPKMLLEVDNTKRTPADYAAQEGHVAVLTHLIDRGADPWCRSCHGQTLLHQACLGGELEMTKYLVETYHKMLHEMNNTQMTPAHFAAERGHLAVLRYLIDRGADPWCRSSHGRTLLHQACLGGELEMTKYLTETYHNMLHEVDNTKRTPAHDAVESGHVAVLSYLIDRGADPWCRTSQEQTLLHIACLVGKLEMTKYLVETYHKMLFEVDNTKRTPAHIAAENGHVAVLSYLIDRGADPWCRSSHGQTLLHQACFGGKLEMTKYLVEAYPKMLIEMNNNQITPAHAAAESGHVAVLSYLIDRGADPWCRTSQEQTLLHQACLGGELEMTKYLTETYPKMLLEVDNTKRTPAHDAAKRGHVAVLSYLIDRGADPWCRSSQGQTLLHQACFGGKLEMTKYLVEAYPNMLLEVDNTKKTPAHDAALSGHVAVLSYLIDRGADPWCRSSHQQTLLHIACLGGELEMTKYLTERYPKMLLEVDNTKRTPADYAAQEGHVAVLTHLIDRGADPCCRTSQEQTLLHASSFYGQLEVTAYLTETYPKMLLEVDSRKRTPAHYAAQRGHVAVLTHIIDRGADPWCRSSQNETLLHTACLGGKLEMTKYLVETYHKMLFEVDNTKRTPAHIAAENGHVAVLSYLIDRGADPWCRTSQEQTLLHQACLGSELEMTKYLTETYPKMLLEMDNTKRTPAHDAAKRGHVAVLSYLIDRGADPWCRSSQGQTLLHQACFGGKLEMTKYLVEAYPNMLLEVDNTKKTPAHDAALSGHVAVLSYLTDRGADPWCRSSHQQTLLHMACFRGELEMTKYLTERYPKMLLEVDNTKRSPADYAAQEGHVAVLTHLIDRGADPCCRTSQEQTLLHASSFYGQLEVTAYLAETYPKMLLEVDSRKRTPAHYAAQRGHVAVLTHIIDRGADPWCRSSQNETLLHTANLGGKLEMTKYLVETYHKMLFEVDNTKRTPAHIAAENGHVAVLSYLIDRGADPWSRTSQEQTLLHQACLGGELEMTKYLTETYPKMLLEVDNTKRTPAHDAAKRGHVAVLSYLIDRGADPWCRSSQGQTLLHQACLGGKLEMTKYLVEAYPNMLLEVDNTKKTPAHDAALSGHVAVLSYLIDRGADPWCRISHQQTLLHMACLGGELEMTKYLTERYPKMLLEVDNTKRSPADYAAQEGHVAVLTHLIDRGADPCCRTSQEQTLLHASSFYGQLEVTAYLAETYPKMLLEVDSRKRTPAHYAAKRGHVAVLTHIIDRGADPWCRSSQNETLLHTACLGGKLEMTKYLVETYHKMLFEVDNTKRTPAHIAAENGHVAVLSYLIDRGADPWCRSSHGQTLLHQACLGGKLEMTKYLVEAYPNMLLEVDNSRRTPAHDAAKRGHVAVLSYLIDRGADPWRRTSQEQTLLHMACFGGELEMTKYLTERYPKMLLEVDNTKRTPPHYAAQEGHVAVLTHLIDRGADPWCRSSHGQTLLHQTCFGGKLEMTKYLVETYQRMLFEVDNTKRTPAHIAAENGHVAVLSYLTDRGADPWCRTSQEQTLLHMACLGGKLEMTKYLTETYPKMLLEVDNTKRTPAHYAAQEGHVAVLTHLIGRGADPWCRSCHGQTLLHQTCFGGKLEMTKYLVETYHKMLHEMNNTQMTPAHFAADRGHVDVLSYLIDRGADPWCRSSRGQTLLHQACLGGKLEMTKYLVEKYPKMLIEMNNNQITPQHTAAESGHVAVLSYLIDRGADPWCRSSHGRTLLQQACLGGELEMTKYLTETYPNMLHEVDNTKRTPAHDAAESGHVAVLSYLIDRGADPWCRTSEEQTLLHIACLGGELEMTKYLTERYPKMLLEVDNTKRTPAHYAAQEGHVAVLTHLIDRGADPCCRTSQEQTLLHASSFYGQLEVTAYLAETYPKMLLEVDSRKRTPAHYAAERGHVPVLTHIIDRGADPWCRSSQNETLLHKACLGGKLEMTKYLVETYHKMLFEVDNTKRTPAHIAAENGHVAVLSYLIDRGADPWCRTSQDETLLHISCLGSELEMTKYLVETYPTMLFEMDKTKRTPGHYATEIGDVDALSYLISRGADPWSKSSR